MDEFDVVGEPAGFSRLLREMRVRAGLTPTQIAQGLGVSPGAVHQYLYRQRGEGGTSTVRWLMRYAAVCGCDLEISFADASRGRMTHGGTSTDVGGSGSVRADGAVGSPRGLSSAGLLG